MRGPGRAGALPAGLHGDRAGLAANMASIARAPQTWSAMGAAGAARVRAEFDLKVWNDRLAERLSTLYQGA